MPHSIAVVGDGAFVAHANKVYKINQHSILKEWQGSSHLDNLTISGKKIVGVLDKSVVQFDDNLEEISTSAFPKRPISLAFKGDHVLVADKFGDVYDLDLAEKVTNAEGEFILEPILGHVSMLLKIAVTDSVVVTCDRDEHIKISNLDQPYIIEGFCFGHTQYVADIAIVDNFLISGGGDSFINKYSLNTYEQVGRLDLSEHFEHTEFNVLRIAKYDANHVLAIFQESPVILNINIETMTIEQQYALPDHPVDISVGSKVWVATRSSVLITDLSTTEAFPEAFGDSEVRILMQHEMRKRAEQCK